MYIRKTWMFGDYIEVHNRYPGRFGARGEQRAERRRKTPEEVRRQNITNRSRKIQRLILANFKPGDFHLILKYHKDQRPEKYEDAQELLKKAMAKMSRELKKREITFKWIRATERGKKGQALHHHLIVQDLDEISVNKLWAKYWPYGPRMFVPLYDNEEYKHLAEYIAKMDTKEERVWGTYSRSRNMIVPQEKIEKMRRKGWPKEPKPKKGYYVVKETIWNGENPYTGAPVQRYMMRRIESGECSNLHFNKCKRTGKKKWYRNVRASTKKECDAGDS